MSLGRLKGNCVPASIREVGLVAKKFKENVEQIGFQSKFEAIQKTALFGAARVF